MWEKPALGSRVLLSRLVFHVSDWDRNHRDPSQIVSGNFGNYFPVSMRGGDIKFSARGWEHE